MKKSFTNFFLFLASYLFVCVSSMAQNGIENIVVEKYYVSNADDEIASVGILPTGSVTYRIFVDMLPGSKFYRAYGSPEHLMQIKTSTSFFNNEDKGSTNPIYTKIQATGNTVMLDSWLSVGAACFGNFGILKSEDDSEETIINYDGVLQNDDTLVGIPLTVQDGLIAGTPDTFNLEGINTAIIVFGSTSQAGNSFKTSNGAWFCENGAVGPTSENKVLIAQITTDGVLFFELNIQIETAAGDTQLFVARNPVNSEIKLEGLIYASNGITDLTHYNNNASNFSISPNPVLNILSINLFSSIEGDNNYYTLYDLTGKPLLTHNIEAYSDINSEEIDMTNFSAGIYLIEVSLNGKKSFKKIIKN